MRAKCHPLAKQQIPGQIDSSILIESEDISTCMPFVSAQCKQVQVTLPVCTLSMGTQSNQYGSRWWFISNRYRPWCAWKSGVQSNATPSQTCLHPGSTCLTSSHSHLRLTWRRWVRVERFARSRQPHLQVRHQLSMERESLCQKFVMISFTRAAWWHVCRLQLLHAYIYMDSDAITMNVIASTGPPETPSGTLQSCFLSKFLLVILFNSME